MHHEVSEVAFELRQEKQILILTVQNQSDVLKIFSSDLNEIVKKTIFGFPKSGALRLWDASGKRVPIQGENSNGWWLPAILSSELKPLEKFKTSDIRFSANEMTSYKFDISGALNKALQFKIGNAQPTKFEVLFPVRYLENGKPETIEIVSPIFSIPDKEHK